MSRDNSEFPSQIPFLYRFRAKIQVYLDNRRVKSSFQRKPLYKPLASLSGVFLVLGLSSMVFGLWFFQNYRISITEVGKEKPSSINPLAKALVVPEEKDLPPLQVKEEEKILEALPAPPIEEAKEEVEATPVAEPLPQPTETSLDSTLQAEKKTEDVSTQEPVPPEEEKKEEYMKTRADLVNLRKDAFLESEILARLDADYVVAVRDKDGDWVKVDAGDDLTGWIYTDLLEAADQEEYLAWVQNPARITARQVIIRDLEDLQKLETEKGKIKEILESWKGAWEAKDIDRYMNFYSPSFATSEHTWESYKTYKGFIFKKPGFISVEISDLSVKWLNNILAVSFIQKYQSDTIKSIRRKVMHFQHEGQDWKILKEAVVVE